MNTTTSHPPSGGRRRNFLRAAVAGLTIAGLALIAYAAAPLANTSIGNQASATYTDDSNVQRTVLSNTVTTLVQQVNGFTLVQPNTRTANPGSQVFFPHTLTNTGNGTDTYTLSAADATGDDFNFQSGSIKIYIDADGDGNPDNYTAVNPTDTITLVPGASYRFIVAATVPVGAIAGQEGKVTVSATSADTGATVPVPVTIPNTDTARIVQGAAMEVTKATSASSGEPGSTFFYTITYRNNGNATATQFKIEDTLPAELAVGAAHWSVTGTGAGAALVSATLPGTVNPGVIAYNLTGQKATFVIGSVTAGANGFVTIAVSVPGGTAPKVLNNTAIYSDTDNTTPQNTNTVTYEVLPQVNLTFVGPGNNGVDPNTPGPDPLYPTIPAGGSAVLKNTLTNTGTGTDTFNVVVNGPGTFPAGTTFQLLKSDGATPLIDTNNDGIADTGPVVASGTYDVYIRITLPSGAASTTTAMTVTKTATSTVDPTKSATATDKVAGITGAGVDLLGATPASDGVGAGNNTVVNTASGNPGSTVPLTLNVKNTGPNPDTFDLLAVLNTSTTAPTFGSTNVLPAGWSVVFKDTSGTVISNTGVIPAGGTKEIRVEVTIPAGTSPLDYSAWFQAKSPSTSASDFLRDQIKVNTVRGITLQTNNVGQTYPGGSVVYQHTLTNTGNITEGANAATNTLTFALADSLTGAGFTSVVYYDVNGNGIIDSGDTIIDTTATPLLSSVLTGGLPAGQSIQLLVKVQAPIGASDGVANITTLTVTPATVVLDGVNAPAAVSNTDTTTVIRGNLTIEKEQSLDNSAWTKTQLTANPGATIYYRITVTNVGSAEATKIVINDTIPANTTNSSVAGLPTAKIYLSTGAEKTSGDTLQVNVSGTAVSVTKSGSTTEGATLQPAEKIVAIFAVNIDN